MHTHTDYFSLIHSENSFFAGANTPCGFSGEYENLLSEEELEKIYMIKGGSGTGKSTLMRYCAENALREGYGVTYLLCSSDPTSLDGIIIENEGKLGAVIDSTAPHTADPQFAGAVGQIVNCGDYWDSAYLEGRREEIVALIKEKKKCYDRAYRFIRAMGEIAAGQSKLACEYTLAQKEREAVKRICKAFPKTGTVGKAVSRRTHCLSMKGAYRLTTFENEKRLFAVRDSAFLSAYFFEILTKELLQYGHTVEVSRYPFGGISEIRIPSLSAAFVPYTEGIEYEKVINLRRFADSDGMARVKQKRQFLARCFSAVTEGALESLGDAGKLHFSLEGIYREAMDFSGIDRMGQKMWEGLKKRLS